MDDEAGALAGVDADPPGGAHAHLREVGGGAADEGEEDAEGDLPGGGIPEGVDEVEGLGEGGEEAEDDADNKEDAAEPLERAGGAGEPVEAGRAGGAAVLEGAEAEDDGEVEEEEGEGEEGARHVDGARG